METLTVDLRQAVRTLRKSPGLAAAAVTMLALGIGVNAAVFTVAKAALFAGFPLVERNDRIAYISHRGCCVSYPDFEDWRAQATSFDDLALVHGVRRVLSDRNGFPESYEATEVTANTFALVGRRPILGRDFAAADEVPGAAPVTILSYGFWERRYGKDPSIVGRTVRINGVPATVIAVMPEGFSFPQKNDLWVPLVPTSSVRERDARETWFVFGRLADGVTHESARAEMAAIGKRLEREHPLTNQGVVPLVQTFREFFILEQEEVIYASMWGAVGVVLLIACANLANLMLARATGRSREMSVRMALGAGRARIVRQLFIESLLLSALGSAAGWWIAKWGVAVYALAERGPGRSSWRILDFTMDYQVLGYTVGIAVGTALLFGLAPALRLSTLDINATLKDGARGVTGGRRGRRVSGALVAGEMALAVVLLAGAGVMIRSFLNVYRGDLGVSTSRVLTASIQLPADTYADEAAWTSFFDRVVTRLGGVAGVESVALASRVPAEGSTRLPFERADAAAANEQERRPTLSALTIAPGYIRTLGARVLSGREFTDADRASSPPVALVNEQFARQQWPGEEPLGKRLRLFAGTAPGPWVTVVGMVSNVLQNDRTRQAFDPLVYLPFDQRPSRSMNVVASTSVPPERLRAAFRREIQAVDPDLPIFGPFTLAERLEGTYWTSGLYGALFLTFATLALLLASLGLYAVIAHSVSQRTQEMGIRMTMGATARDILALVARQGALPVTLGLAVGLAASPAVNRIVASQLVQVSPTDPLTLLVSCAVLVSAAMLGCWIPARRAMRVDPLTALRHE